MSGLARVWIGTSGYVYRHWRKGVFYPVGLPAREELGHYSERFRTVELNNPFYRLPTAQMFDRWCNSTPAGFVFAVKASRYITHIKRLRDAGDALAVFLERAERLNRKLGPILFQLPPTQHADTARLGEFLALLDRAHRWVLEFRHVSWHTHDVYQLLTNHAVALCIPVGGGVHPDRVTTAPFTYLRMHRGEEAAGGFNRSELVSWARQIQSLRRAGKEVYVYFNNDWGGFAVRDAMALQELVGTAEPR
jgi:uncharacterized protein YecE (DUF72 family)